MTNKSIYQCSSGHKLGFQLQFQQFEVMLITTAFQSGQFADLVFGGVSLFLWVAGSSEVFATGYNHLDTN